MDNICRDCGEAGEYLHYYTGEYICKDCIQKYTICTTCGFLFDNEDAKHWTSINRCLKCDEE